MKNMSSSKILIFVWLLLKWLQSAKSQTSQKLPNEGEDENLINFETPVLSRLESLAEAVQAVGRRYHAVCIVLLHPYESNHVPEEVFRFFRLLSTDTGHVCCVSLNFEKFSTYLDEQDHLKCSRTMNIIFGEGHLTKPLFTQMTFSVTMAGPLWLIILKDESLTDYLGGCNLPFDVDLVTAQQVSDHEVKFHEAYRASLDRPIRVLKYGSWSSSSGLISPPHVSLYYRRQDFEGIVFKAATAESYPVVSVKKKNGVLDISGYFSYVWKDLESRLNFSTIYMTPSGNSTGVLRNGSWSGVMGMVVSGETDVAVAAIIQTSRRGIYVDFLRPLISTRNNIFIKTPGMQIKWNAIFRPFEKQVWITILIWILIGSVFLYFAVRMGVYCKCEPKKTIPHYTLANTFFTLLRVFSSQGTTVIPEGIPGRLIIISSYLVGVVIMSAYSGALISFITVETPRLPFNSLNDFVNNTYLLQVVKDSASYMYFANATDPILHAAFEKMETNLPITHGEGLQRVCDQNRLAHFGPEASVNLIVKELNLRGCNIMALPNALNTVYISVIIQKENQYRDALNHHLDMMIYQGLLGRLRKQLWPNIGALAEEHVVEVQAEQVIPIYVILIAGIVLAVILMSAERMKKKDKCHLKGPLRVIRLCLLAVLLPGLLIAVPLYLRYRVYSEQTVPLATSDQRMLDNKISTTWCQRQLISSNTTFNAYLMAQQPSLQREPKFVNMMREIVLEDDMKEYWGFYLLKGSIVTVSSCCRRPGATLIIIKGHNHLRQCAYIGDDSSEEEDELEELREKQDENRKYSIPANMQRTRTGVLFHGNQTAISNDENILQKDLDLNEKGDEFDMPQLRDHMAKAKQKQQRVLERNEKIDSIPSAELIKAVINKLKGYQKEGKQPSEEVKGILKNDRDKESWKWLREKLTNYSDSSNEHSKENVKTGKGGGRNSTQNEINLSRKERHIRLMEAMKQNLNRHDEGDNHAEEQGVEHQEVRGTINGMSENDTSNSEFWSSFSSSEERLLECDGLILSLPLQPSPKCHRKGRVEDLQEVCSHQKISYSVPGNGYYFFVFSSENEIQPNYIRAYFQLEKMQFNISNPVATCENSTGECSLPLNFFSHERLVLELPVNHSLWNSEFLVVSTCEPRTAVYVACIIAVPVLILLCAF